MLSIFRKKEQKKTGNDTTISTEELMNVKEETNETEIKTVLSFHPTWNLLMEQQYAFRFLHNELPPLQPNQISIAGVDLAKAENGIEVTAFLRNSLQKPIMINETPLLLLDKEQNVIAREVFDLGKLGNIPERSSMPWVFHFPLHSLRQQEFSEEGWTLAFELKKPHSLDLHESWETGLSEEDKGKLQAIIDRVGEPNKGEVNFMGISIAHNEENLTVTLLIRNGTEQNIHLHQIPLAVKDASKNIIAQGAFTLDDFIVKANTSKPWTFIFPSSFIKAEEMDLSRWSVEVIQNEQ